MIYTVTFNPSVDYIMRMDTLSLGGLNRAKDTEKYPGGKGINVSRILKESGKDSTALGFVGGFTGDYIKYSLDVRGIHHDFIEVDEDTRINVKLKTDVESELNASGPNIARTHFEALTDKLTGLDQDDHVVFAGSVPKGYDDAYKKLAEQLHAQNIPFSIDTEGDRLTSSLPFKPYLAKPNLFELEEIAGEPLTHSRDIVSAAHRLIESGAQNILVTLGGDGAIFVNKEISYKISSPAGELINSVGAGDSTVAGFIARQDEDLEHRVKYAIAAGSATAYNSDLAGYDDIIGLFDAVSLERI